MKMTTQYVSAARCHNNTIDWYTTSNCEAMARWEFSTFFVCFNSLRPGDAYMHQEIVSSLVQIMTCLISAKLLSEPKLASRIARFMGPTWGPSGADRTEVGPMLAPWTLLSGLLSIRPLGTKFNKILIEMQFYSLKKLLLKMSSTKYWPCCSASMC